MADKEESLAEENERLREENRLLRAKIDLLVRKIFGPSSEGLDPAQLQLLLEADDEASLKKSEAPAEAQEPAAGAEQNDGQSLEPKVKAPRKPRLPENVPLEEEEVIVPTPVKACPEAWRRIGEEVTDELDYRPARFFRRRITRPKFVRRADPEAAPITAKLPGRVIEGGIAAPGLIAQVVVAKYCDHLPLYRQEQIYHSRHGVDLPRQSLARWVEAAASWLQPIYRQMRQGIFEDSYVQADETPVKYLAPGTGKAQQGYLWTYSKPDGDVIFDWQPGRGAKYLQKFVPKDFKGVIQSDGYSAYPAFAKIRGNVITLAACWAHVRRKFHEAYQVQPEVDSAWTLKKIGELYRLERQLRKARAGPKERHISRQREAKPILEGIFNQLQHLKVTRAHLPKSPMGRAIDYALGQRAALGTYLDDGHVEIDNNLCENAIRPTAIGKKNWLHIGAEDAGWRSAVIYSIVESCRRRKIEPYTYLKDVLTRLPQMTNQEVWSMTPENWAEQKNAEIKTAS